MLSLRSAVRSATAVLALGLAVSAAPLRAQSPADAEDEAPSAADSAALRRAQPSTRQTTDGPLAERLPVDRVDDALALLPGVTQADSALWIRGLGPEATATYIDGIPVTSGFRGPSFFFGQRAVVARPELGLNALGSGLVLPGVASASLGDATGGTVLLTTRRAGDEWRGGLAYQNDSRFNGNGAGLNRIEASLGGPVGRGFRAFAAITATGRRSQVAATGGRDEPVYADVGVDTTLIHPALGHAVPVTAFAVARGDCEALEGASLPAIADNYGVECGGARTPGSSGSAWQASASLEYRVGGGSVTLLGLASQDQSRLFDLVNLYNPQGHAGRRQQSRLAGLVWRLPVGSAELESHLSVQSNRVSRGYFASGGAPGTGHLGLYLKPYPFAFGLEDFVFDDSTRACYRTHLGCSAIDLPDVEPVGSFPSRRNPYGLFMAGTDGVPGDAMQRTRERRAVAGSALTVRRRSGELRVGAEVVRSRAEQLFTTPSGVLRDFASADPEQWAAWVEQSVRRGTLTVSTGVRYDVFSSNVERPFFVCSTALAFDGRCGSGDGSLAIGDTSFVPRISSNPQFVVSQPDAVFRRDARHSAVSPRIRLEAALSARSTLRAAWGQQAQAPGFGPLLAGSSTDLQYTSSSFVWGTDLGLELARTLEVGLRQSVGRTTTLDLSGFRRDQRDVVGGGFQRTYDPALGTMRNLRVYTAYDPERIMGGEARIDARLGRRGTLALGYALLDLPEQNAGLPFSARPHSVTGTLAFLLPNGRATDGLFVTGRWASGTAYRPCGAGALADAFALSDALTGCEVPTSEIARLPAFRQLDLRIAKTVPLGGAALTIFGDARNLLGWNNIRRLFAATGTTASETALAATLDQGRSDYALSAIENGFYDDATGSIDLRFGSNRPRTDLCTSFMRGGIERPDDCVYLIRAEQRFGNGDGVFTTAEQDSATTSFYRALLGEAALTGEPRTIRLGISLGF